MISNKHRQHLVVSYQELMRPRDGKNPEDWVISNQASFRILREEGSTGVRKSVFKKMLKIHPGPDRKAAINIVLIT